MNKLIKDGMVAVLVSPGYGAGWSTWNSNAENILFDPELAQAVLDKKSLAELTQIARAKWPEAYLGGLQDIEVQWVSQGTRFEIEEYDGSESIREFTGQEGEVA